MLDTPGKASLFLLLQEGSVQEAADVVDQPEAPEDAELEALAQVCHSIAALLCYSKHDLFCCCTCKSTVSHSLT